MRRFTILQLLVTTTLAALLLLTSLSVLVFYPAFTETIPEEQQARAWAALVMYLFTVCILAALIFYSSLRARKLIAELEKAEKSAAAYQETLATRKRLYNAILAVQTPEAVARIAVHHLASLGSWENIAVYSYDFDEQLAFLLAAKSRQEPPADIVPTDDIAGLEILNPGNIFRQNPENNREHPGLCTIKTPLLSGSMLVGSVDLVCKNETDISALLPAIEELSGPLAIAIQNARLFTSVDRQQHQLRSLSARLTEMEEAERRKIAIELHDRVGQNLSALNINLNIIKSRMKAGLIDGAELCIADSFLLIEGTTEQIRDIMSDLRPPNLDDHGLLSAIRWHAQQRTKRTGLEIVVEGNGSAPRLPLEIEMVLFRIAQEALNNIIKHAKAHSAKVVVERLAERTIMIISDDGIGFDPNTLGRHHREHSGLGLIAMQERVSALGGTLSIESAKGKGAKLIVEV
ncbi:MAG: sensor histidine kinase [Proteobacteria bacterium]|nr:sensor histidine kinase [Pseudomonadota bacterium]MBU1739663.1 sensor histidine kinase [Pseudomonadota bacterium]